MTVEEKLLKWADHDWFCLQGDELLEVIEQRPDLAKALADELGVSMAELRPAASLQRIAPAVIRAALGVRHV